MSISHADTINRFSVEFLRGMTREFDGARSDAGMDAGMDAVGLLSKFSKLESQLEAQFKLHISSFFPCSSSQSSEQTTESIPQSPPGTNHLDAHCSSDAIAEEEVREDLQWATPHTREQGNEETEIISFAALRQENILKHMWKNPQCEILNEQDKFGPGPVATQPALAHKMWARHDDAGAQNNLPQSDLQQQQHAKCQNGHPLTKYQIYRGVGGSGFNSHRCNAGCQRLNIKAPECIWRCKTCDYDMCHACWSTMSLPGTPVGTPIGPPNVVPMDMESLSVNAGGLPTATRGPPTDTGQPIDVRVPDDTEHSPGLDILEGDLSHLAQVFLEEELPGDMLFDIDGNDTGSMENLFVEEFWSPQPAAPAKALPPEAAPAKAPYSRMAGSQKRGRADDEPSMCSYALSKKAREPVSRNGFAATPQLPYVPPQDQIIYL